LSAISKHKEKLLLSLRDFCCAESIDKENKPPKLVVITESQAVSLRFEKQEDRDHWVDAIVSEGGFGEGTVLCFETRVFYTSSRLAPS
jgi:hypothetical protein